MEHISFDELEVGQKYAWECDEATVEHFGGGAGTEFDGGRIELAVFDLCTVLYDEDGEEILIPNDTAIIVTELEDDGAIVNIMEKEMPRDTGEIICEDLFLSRELCEAFLVPYPWEY